MTTFYGRPLPFGGIPGASTIGYGPTVRVRSGRQGQIVATQAVPVLPRTTRGSQRHAANRDHEGIDKETVPRFSLSRAAPHQPEGVTFRPPARRPNQPTEVNPSSPSAQPMFAIEHTPSGVRSPPFVSMTGRDGISASQRTLLINRSEIDESDSTSTVAEAAKLLTRIDPADSQQHPASTTTLLSVSNGSPAAHIATGRDARLEAQTARPDGTSTRNSPIMTSNDTAASTSTAWLTQVEADLIFLQATMEPLMRQAHCTSTSGHGKPPGAAQAGELRISVPRASQSRSVEHSVLFKQHGGGEIGSTRGPSKMTPVQIRNSFAYPAAVGPISDENGGVLVRSKRHHMDFGSFLTACDALAQRSVRTSVFLLSVCFCIILTLPNEGHLPPHVTTTTAQDIRRRPLFVALTDGSDLI